MHGILKRWSAPPPCSLVFSQALSFYGSLHRSLRLPPHPLTFEPSFANVDNLMKGWGRG